MRPLNAGQAIALSAVLFTFLGVVLTVLKDRFGKRVDRAGSLDVRQSAIEQNLYQQLALVQTALIAANQRIDRIEGERTASEAQFRQEIETGAAERRKIEAEFREALRLIEIENQQLRDHNEALVHENWLLKRGAIGIGEALRESPALEGKDRYDKQ